MLQFSLLSRKGNDVRRIIVLIALVLILALLVALRRSVASWQHYIISGEPGALVYAATFDGGATDGFNADWTQYAGRLSAAVANGQMQITVGDVGAGAYSITAPHFGDFDVRVDAQLIGGSEQNAYGLVFRLQNQDNSVLEDDNYYLFLISGDGYYRVTRVIAGKVKVISDWINSALIQQGLNTVNHLRVVAQGDQFRFYINGQSVQLCVPDDPSGESTYSGGKCFGTMIDTLTDATIPNGQIGVTTQWLEEVGGTDSAVGAFDNLLVYGPSES